ncbi:MAG TPA: PaaI family thioesterase [Bryobacteraceae bacterium]|nr:PaaI family thioesterase [Bryobacteraceae bacterium]
MNNFNEFLGIEIVGRHEDGITIRIQLRQELLNFGGVVHGGVTASAADIAVGVGLMDRFEGKQLVTTTELKINYLLPVTGAWLDARAKFVRVGKTLAVAQVDMADDRGRLVAIALVTYMLLPKPE